jgi:tetratricopeptide (TPR) repeat protein
VACLETAFSGVNLEEKALRQLAWIKWLLIVIVVAFVIANGTTSWYMWGAFSSTGQAKEDCAAVQSESCFQQQAKNLLMKGKEGEALKLASAREAIFPKDPYVFLYRARAYFQLGEYESAIEDYRRAEALVPDWREQYVGPYVAEAKRRLSIQSSGSAANNEPPPTEAEIYDLQTQKYFEQQERMDQLLLVQEEQTRRFDAVLQAWERQAGLRKR